MTGERSIGGCTLFAAQGRIDLALGGKHRFERGEARAHRLQARL
jgi:hypothetical protein